MKNEDTWETASDIKTTYEEQLPRWRCPECGEIQHRIPELERCTCRQPLWVSIPPGQHIHIHCPLHGDQKLYGQPRVEYRYGYGVNPNAKNIKHTKESINE